MRYKGTFRPQYILGQLTSPILWSTPILTAKPKDPESLTWDPLDGTLVQKLDQQPYVSLSRDSRSRGGQDVPSPPDTDPDADADEEINDEDASLFDLHMPGVLTAEEVEALDLDHWLLLVRGSFVHMIVRCPPTPPLSLSLSPLSFISFLFFSSPDFRAYLIA